MPNREGGNEAAIELKRRYAARPGEQAGAGPEDRAMTQTAVQPLPRDETVEITSEMIEAGACVLRAWWHEPYGGEDDPMLEVGRLVSKIFSEMIRTSIQAQGPHSTPQV